MPVRLSALLVAAAVAAPVVPALAAPVAVAAPVRTASLAAASPVPALGHDRLTVRRADTWILSGALDGSGVRSYREQIAGWRPVAGDTDGDGDDGLSLFRDGVWLVREREGAVPTVVRFGQDGDQPLMGDWDGDGRDGLAVFRRGRWFVKQTLLSPWRSFTYGLGGDTAVVGDWNGDRRTDIGVRRSTTWFQRDAVSAGPTSRSFSFGLSGDLPVAGDWDHDGRDTPGLFRSGTWLLGRSNAAGPHQTVRLGSSGDRPVVRRTQGLAPGVRHQVVRSPSYVAHVARIDLAAASSPETTLAGGRLGVLERTSVLTRRAGAVVGVNGDFFLGSGRPVHLFANDGRLVQSPTVLGRAVSLDAAGTGVRMGHPDLRTTLTTAQGSLAVPRTNLGTAPGAALAAFTAHGSGVGGPAAEQCYASLLPRSGRRTVAGAVQQPMTVTGTRCYGAPPVVSGAYTFVSADPRGAGGAAVRGLAKDAGVTLTTQLGFPGAVDVIGGNPQLVRDGAVVSADVDRSGAFHARNPRTAVGWTRAGELLLVVVDGRQPGYSSGATMRELADLLRGLGAHAALNLDGGGSSTMVLNGVLASRPSEPERPVANALVVLPGADAGQRDLLGATATAQAVDAAPAPLPATAVLRGPAVDDPASTGGLADALQRQGLPLTADLRRTAAAFRESR